MRIEKFVTLVSLPIDQAIAGGSSPYKDAGDSDITLFRHSSGVATDANDELWLGECTCEAINDCN